MKLGGHEKFLLMFAPEQMNAVQKVGLFPCSNLDDERKYRSGIKATADHLEKFLTLAEVANDLAKGFEIDRQELEEKGHTPAIYSRKFAAVSECCINELYAALDGVRDVIYGVYKPVQGVQKKSTSKLFSKANQKQYGEGFPVELNNLLSTAYNDWFCQLRTYRTEFTHGSLGSCSMDHETKKISYMHSALGSGSNSLIIEDFVEYINNVYACVLTLQERVFDFLYSALELSESRVLCGIYQGRAYMRSIQPVENLSVHSGSCMSVNYSDPCPLKEQCGAYSKAVED
ncbi:hypothetical protein KS872_004746 [Vibrio parahaemolyticus]|uniref:hypothetical protein n=1 Tax=Vibrio parahaemolyticus TaxID=670 RepID=UPI00030AA418|nr:hypothetical protein [Vibrio parahaemolyticus]EHR0574937.1 hypothetical protein [Vibrio parahaemolyticus]EJA7342629.1 hypothetical protein [Vibrio parahaemolyticus]EJE4149815.1 hypothetical protein [Vibrio parahaemolyticus]EKZ9070433.1 hypothetical protein [Vibrio parahaemolyticus]EME0114634.1 hypothetical protein [Vibrio parahaemolyticus]